MTGNDVLRSIRNTLNVRDAKLIEIIALAGCKVEPHEITAYLKREDEPGYVLCPHHVTASFLDGLVIYKRGKDPKHPLPPLETPVTNNIILKKLRVAFELKDTDIIELIGRGGLVVTKSELGAFFRHPSHRNYRECGDQYVRNLLKGLTP